VGLLAGCSGNNADPAGRLDPATPVQSTADGAPVSGTPAAGMPTGLPDDDYVDPSVIAARRGSVLLDQHLSGDACTRRSENTVLMPVSASLRLQPEPESLAWAMYRFENLLPEDSPLYLNLELLKDPPNAQAYEPPQILYVGIGNYGAMSWSWTELARPQESAAVLVPQSVNAVSPGGSVYVVVLIEDGERARLGGLTLFANILAPPPLNPRTSIDNPHPEWIEVTWDGVTESYHGIAFDCVQVERRLDDESSWQVIAEVDPGETTYRDTASSSNDISYGTPVLYRLRTVVNQTAGLATAEVAGERRFQDYIELTASQGTHPDRIELQWTDVPGAQRIEIHGRIDDEFFTVDELNEPVYRLYDHYWNVTPGYEVGFGPDNGCAYWIRAHWGELATQWSYGVYGYRDLPPVTNVQASQGTFPDKVVITWDPLPGAKGYVVWFDDNLGAGPPQVIDHVEGEHVTFLEHHASAPGLPECRYDHVNSYGVCGSFNGDYSATWEQLEMADGYRFLHPPTNLQASDDTHSDRVVLNWEKPTGATGYVVYRDGQASSDIVATLGDVSTWDDTTLTDTGFHTYWLQATWGGLASDFSEPDAGSLNMFTSHVIESITTPEEFQLINNLPAFVQNKTWDEDQGQYYTRALTGEPAASSDWSTHRLSDHASASDRCDIAEIGGLPAIAYTDNDEQAVFYAVASSTTPEQAGDWQAHQVTGSSSTATVKDFAEINGHPAICFRSTAQTDQYIRASVASPASGADWLSPVRTANGLGGEIKLMDKSGLPLIVNLTGDCLYTIANTAEPQSILDWNTCLFGNGIFNVGSFALQGSTPVHCYFNSEHNMVYVRSRVPDPLQTADWDTTIIDDQPGSVILVDFIDGKPVVCYRTGYNTIMYAAAAVPQPAGIEDWTSRPLYSQPSQHFVSLNGMVVVDGKPLVLYRVLYLGETRCATLTF